jgi:hypothetical protein
MQPVGDPQRGGNPIHTVDVSEESAEGIGVLGVLIEQLLAVGYLAGLDG